MENKELFEIFLSEGFTVNFKQKNSPSFEGERNCGLESVFVLFSYLLDYFVGDSFAVANYKDAEYGKEEHYR